MRPVSPRSAGALQGGERRAVLMLTLGPDRHLPLRRRPAGAEHRVRTHRGQGKDAEHRAADSARKRDDLSWKEYAERLDEYLHRIEFLLWPDLIIIGGGISKKSEKFFPTSRRELRWWRPRCTTTPVSPGPHWPESTIGRPSRPPNSGNPASP